MLNLKTEDRDKIVTFLSTIQAPPLIGANLQMIIDILKGLNEIPSIKE